MKKVLMVIGALCVIAFGGCAIVGITAFNSVDKAVTTSAPATDSNTKQTEAKKETKKDNSKLTLDKFNKLKTDMSYDQVVKILDSKGEVMSESEVGGIKTVMYTWKGPFGANMNATFQNDKLMSKAQLGLE